MITYEIATLWDGLWQTLDTVNEDHDGCPPQRILTGVLHRWLENNGETEGQWKLTAYQHGTNRAISQSEVIELS